MVSDAQILQIVAELKSSSLTIAEASNVFQRIADFSFDEGNVAKFEEMGGFLALMDVMRTHRVSVEVSRSGCEIIGNISMINREDLNNAWQYIVIKAMQLHWRDRGISKWGSRAIGELAKNRDILGDMGACEMISRVMRIYGKYDSEIAYWTCFAVTNLCDNIGERNAESFERAGGCEMVIGALQAHENDTDVTIWGCQALGRLASGCIPNIVKIRETGGCEIILRAIETHGSNPKVAQAGCYAVSELIQFRGGDDAYIFGPIGGCEIVLSAIRTHINNAKAIGSACNALSRLATSDKNSAKFGLMGGCQVLLEILRTYCMDREIVCCGCEAIGRLANNSAMNRSTFHSTNVTALISSLIALHPKSIVKDRGEQALMRLAQ